MSRSNSIRSQLELDPLNILQLDILDEELADQINIDLINNGRQSLLNHQDDIPGDIFLNLMKDNTQRLIILKKSASDHWSSIVYPSYSWIRPFIEEYQTKSIDLYEEIPTRSAEYDRQQFRLVFVHNSKTKTKI